MTPSVFYWIPAFAGITGMSDTIVIPAKAAILSG